MSGSTSKYVIPYPTSGDTIAGLPTQIQNLAARLDLLLGESGQVSITVAANTTDTKAVTLSRTYPGNSGAAVPGIVICNLSGTATSALAWNFWVPAWVGTATTITGFSLSTSWSGAQSGRILNWRFIPVL